MIPISTSLKPRSVPYANYLLIALNVIFFLLTSYYWPFEIPKGFDRESGRMVAETLHPWAMQFMLRPDRPFIWQFITYAFLHGGWMHIIGNMYFLYLFGNAVNDRLGNVGYLCFYLAGAAFSGIGHALLSNTPVLGASGAVAAVTGAYLVLFPNAVITVAYMFFYIWDTLEIRALYFIALKLIVWDNYLQPKLSPQAIAYSAHLAGYAFGIVCIIILLAVRLMDAGHDSLWAILRQWNRRRVFHDVVSDDYNPYEGKPAKSVSTDTPAADQQNLSEIAGLREQITSALVSRNLPQAANLYKELLKLDPVQTLSQQNQLDLANTLMSDSQWDWAAKAYENYLVQYGQNTGEQVQLMLGLLYTRYIHKPDRAKELLGNALGKLTQPGQIRMCKDLLAELS
jgi:membrane associated rhomboid family serine protease